MHEDFSLILHLGFAQDLGSCVVFQVSELLNDASEFSLGAEIGMDIYKF